MQDIAIIGNRQLPIPLGRSETVIILFAINTSKSLFVQHTYVFNKFPLDEQAKAIKKADTRINFW
ncbi:hypothetical protein BH20PSE1_BH20PSE1_02750 [soil metagenome]